MLCDKAENMIRIHVNAIFALILLLVVPLFGCAQDMTIESGGVKYIRFDEALAHEGGQKDAFLQIKKYMEKQGKDVTEYYVDSNEQEGILTVIIIHKLDLLNENQWKSTGTTRGSMACEYDNINKKLLTCLVSS